MTQWIRTLSPSPGDPHKAALQKDELRCPVTCLLALACLVNARILSNSIRCPNRSVVCHTQKRCVRKNSEVWVSLPEQGIHVGQADHELMAILTFYSLLELGTEPVPVCSLLL